MAKPISIYTLLKTCNDLPNKKDRVLWLRKNTNTTLNTILKFTFDPNIKFLLPEGCPPIKDPIYDEPGYLYSECKRFYLFVEGGNQNLKQRRREELFINVLENISEDDRKVILGMKDKKLPFANINYKLVKEALPFLFEETNEKV